jgi:hypothetical protein
VIQTRALLADRLEGVPPDMTVVVPTFNGSAHLSPTLTSLARQRDVTLEVIVVDDGSTDESPAIAEAHSARARVIRQENRGVAAARNRGLAEARANWVAFLDQDDLWHPDRASRLIKLARETGARAVATTEQAFALSSDREALRTIGDGREQWPAHWLDGDDEIEALLSSPIREDGPVESITLTQLLSAPATVMTALMYEREAAITAGGCATFVRAADDHVLNVSFARIFGAIPRARCPLLFYRVHPASSTTTSPMVVAYLTALLALRHGRVLPPEPVSSGYVNHLLSQLQDASISPIEQAALLVLSTSPRDRPRASVGWAKRLLRSRLRR